MNGKIWLVSRRSAFTLALSPDPETPPRVVSGLLDLLRAEGGPAVIAIDGADHDVRLADAAVKLQLRFPDAILMVCFDDARPSETERLLKEGVDEVSAPASEWAGALMRALADSEGLGALGWIGKSEATRQLAGQVRQAAPADIAVLITGESGTGKELVAKGLHALSPRAAGPFLPVNTGAIPEALLESELFGHEKGAFTGAAARHAGIFEAARGGTVFLDEIGDMPAATQVKLLRVLESGRFRRVGGTHEIESDVRVISATHRDLRYLETEGSFRKDLYYRLSAITLHASPLRDRTTDILPLLFHFWKSSRTGQAPPAGAEPGAVRMLWNHGWPGNVRELRNFALASAVVVAGGILREEHVLQYIQRQRSDDRNLPVAIGARAARGDSEVILHAILHLSQQVRDLQKVLEERLPPQPPEESAVLRPPAASVAEAERRAIEAALIETGGNRREAARRLGIGERTLYRKIKEYGFK